MQLEMDAKRRRSRDELVPGRSHSYSGLNKDNNYNEVVPVIESKNEYLGDSFGKTYGKNMTTPATAVTTPAYSAYQAYTPFGN